MVIGVREKEFILGLTCIAFLIKNKIMKKLKIVFVVCLGVLIYSCDSKTYEEIQPPVTPIDTGFRPSYEKDIKPLLEASCVDCHSTGGINPYLETYKFAKTATDNKLICRLEGTTCGAMMPKGGTPWTKATIDVIKLWKSQGYLEK
jgi:hypothetical protein